MLDRRGKLKTPNLPAIASKSKVMIIQQQKLGDTEVWPTSTRTPSRAAAEGRLELRDDAARRVRRSAARCRARRTAARPRRRRARPGRRRRRRAGRRRSATASTAAASSAFDVQRARGRAARSPGRPRSSSSARSAGGTIGRSIPTWPSSGSRSRFQAEVVAHQTAGAPGRSPSRERRSPARKPRG